MEGVFVVDGSPDGSSSFCDDCCRSGGSASQLVTHSRNFGSFAAIRTGFAVARGDFMAAMAADLQEPAELVKQFFGHLASGEYDVAVGARAGRADPRTTMLLSRAFWSLYRRWVHREIPPAAWISSAVPGKSQPNWSSLTNLARASSGCSIGSDSAAWKSLMSARRARPVAAVGHCAGSSTYFLDSVFSFTDIPVTLLMVIGAIGGGVTAIGSVVVLVAKLTGAIQQTGYTPLMLVILLSTFALMFSLGIVGSYVWRTYENSKGRPGAVAMTRRPSMGRATRDGAGVIRGGVTSSLGGSNTAVTFGLVACLARVHRPSGRLHGGIRRGRDFTTLVTGRFVFSAQARAPRPLSSLLWYTGVYLVGLLVVHVVDRGGDAPAWSSRWPPSS